MIKSLIKQRFSRSLETYNKDAVVQKQMAWKLLEMTDNTDYGNILELGCGTGFVTRLVNEKLKYNCYDAVDMVEGCGKYIESISNDINFFSADIEKYHPDKKYDLIISNAAFQWLDDFSGFMNRIKNSLNTGGTFAFTLFGKRNFEQLNFVNKTNLKYFSKEELKEILKDYEIEQLKEEIITIDFNAPKDVLLHMKNTGVNALKSCHWTKSDLREFETEYNNVCNGEIKLTYNPIYAVLKKF